MENYVLPKSVEQRHLITLYESSSVNVCTVRCSKVECVLRSIAKRTFARINPERFASRINRVFGIVSTSLSSSSPR